MALIAETARMEALLAAGLDRPEGWERHLARPTTLGGRGGATCLTLPGGPAVLLKRMRRGGAFAFFWHGRYAGTRRLLDNLRVPLEAARRGIDTARPVALLLVPGPPGLWRAWLAVEAIEAAEDLTACFRGPAPPSEGEVDAVAGLVRRMHDRGVEHRDLNLGNLLLQRVAGQPSRPFVIDLDRGRLWDVPLPIGPRVAALRRLERSTVKLLGERPVAAFDLRRRWYEAYAAGDSRLARRLDRARRANRFRLALHRPGWG